MARRVTVGLVACFFFFDPCHATLLSSRLPSRAEGIFPSVDTGSGKLLYRKQPSSVASHSLCALHPSEYHSANVDLHPFSTSSEGTTCPPDETFRTFFFCHVCLSPRPGQRSFFDSSVIERARPRDIDFFASYAFRTSPPGDDHPFQSFYSMEGFFVISRLLCIVRVLYIHTRARVLHGSFIQNSLSRMNFARFQREN